MPKPRVGEGGLYLNRVQLNFEVKTLCLILILNYSTEGSMCSEKALEFTQP
jgi:hypothetical protein